MIIDDLLMEANMSRYKLSKESGVPQTTISDICSGKTTMEKCSAGTLYKLAKTLNVTVDALIEANQEYLEVNYQRRSSFEVFKSEVCHRVKDMGDLEFVIETLETDKIRELYDLCWYPETLYLLAMVDYLSGLNDLPICTNYNDIRKRKLKEVIYPSSVLIQSAVTHDDEIKKQAIRDSIPEFMRFNIVENEVRNIV